MAAESIAVRVHRLLCSSLQHIPERPLAGLRRRSAGAVGSELLKEEVRDNSLILSGLLLLLCGESGQRPEHAGWLAVAADRLQTQPSAPTLHLEQCGLPEPHIMGGAGMSHHVRCDVKAQVCLA